MESGGYEIRGMTPADLDRVSEVLLAGGLGDRREFLCTAMARSDCRPVGWQPAVIRGEINHAMG